MPDDFADDYAGLIQRHLGRKPRRTDGLSDAAIRRREKELGVKLPASLRAYYRTAGKLTQLNTMHNILYDLPGLLVEDGYLIFMEENQAVVHWCFRLSDLDQTDPDVWQRVNCEPPEWYSEEMPFSTFIARMFDWQAGLDYGAAERSGKS
jgi:hypothetical protein